tara:strand:- start:63 stop:509 length:447 start_codon:yes stop_codon:yes gene_type:complete
MNNKLILITCLFIANLLGDDIDSTKFKFAIYPELIGLGGTSSINIEYPINNNYIVRFGLGMLDQGEKEGQAITLPIAIYKIDTSKNIKRQKGLGIYTVIPSELGIVGIYNFRFEPTNNSFIRIGWIGGITFEIYPITLPIIGFGFKFN